MSRITVIRLLACMFGGALLAAGVLAAPPAQARVVSAHTEVAWTGSPCLGYYNSAQSNPYTTGWAVTCSPTHLASYDETRSTGQVIGVDPEMGDNSWIACAIWVNGVLTDRQSAYAGDGNEVNCVRVVNP